MHPSSFKAMQEISLKYLDPSQELHILDVGSYDVNGSYQEIFSNEKWRYVGMDVSKGPNVDVVCDPYEWDFEEGVFDCVVSGQCLEHVEKPWVWIREVERVLSSGGITAIIAPWEWPIHRVPVDCWRILPDGMAVLFGLCRDLRLVKCSTEARDTVAIGIKGSLLKKEFERAKRANTDIHGHLEIIKTYADQCDSVTEFGVRNAMSTVAFLNSKARVISYEIFRKPRVDYIQNICELEGKDWKFVLQSSLEADILETDFLFIDSCHTYEHLKKELKLHAHKARKFIGFHDTTTYRDKGEKEGSAGIWAAIEELLSGGLWKIVEKRPNNNGLTIVGR